MDEQPIILSDIQPMNGKVYRIYEDSMPTPAETLTCLLRLRELGVPVYKLLEENRTVVCVHRPSIMAPETIKLWSALEGFFSRPVVRIPLSSKRLRKVSYADDVLGYSRDVGEKVSSQIALSQQALEKCVHHRTRDELTVHKTQQSLILDDHNKEANHLSLLDFGTTPANNEANPNLQLDSASPTSEPIAVYKRYYTGAYCHQSADIMARAELSPGPGNREVKTWFQLPQYAILESPMEVSASHGAIQQPAPISTIKQNEISNVVIINDIKSSEVPNGLKGIHNLFSNYGNVDKVVYNPVQDNCLVYF